ncbi:2-oxo acid dehydrogenase subunit E2 [Candidatus Woesearchaeota archaeon]|nr:2-oxo acid dehydrogenase subunit E2 [Candidatus Woesearchaeota archaeon]
MPTEFKFPDVGEGIAEGEIVKWLVDEGDEVVEDQNIVQVETDKAVVDLPSPKSGTILKINFKEGESVKVGQTICVIGDKNDKISKKISAQKSAQKKNERKTGSVVGELEEADGIFEMPHSEAVRGIQETAKVVAAPAVRKKAKELGIDLTEIKGSGAQGNVSMRDLISHAKKSEIEIEKEEIPQQKIQVKRKYDEYGYVERIPLKGIRKTIAQNMIKSLQNSAQLTAMEDIDVSKLWRIREREKKNLEKKNIKLTFLPFIIKAAIAALRENPILNSTIENEEIIIKKYFNIGIAVETEAGLMVVVVKRAEDKNIVQIAKEIVELAEKARTRKIDLMDLQGGTFTITNYGSVGGTYATPILNLDEAGILGLGKIFERAVLANGKLKNVKILPISLTFDHRILDGAEAARFIESLKKFLEDPDHLLLEMK